MLNFSREIYKQLLFAILQVLFKCYHVNCADDGNILGDFHEATHMEVWGWKKIN